MLAPGGIFIAIQKTYPAPSEKAKDKRVGKLRVEYRAVMDRYFGKKVDSARNYNPIKTLKKYGFIDITEDVFPVQEKYTLRKAMMLLRSISNWNLLSDTKKDEFYQDVYGVYKKNLMQGYVVRDCVVKVVAGRLPRN